MIYIKNITLTDMIFTGQLIPAGQYYLIQPVEVLPFSFSEDLLQAILDGKCILASSDDGLTDITDPASALSFLKTSTSTQYITIELGAGGTIGDTWLQVPATGKGTDEAPYIMLFAATLVGLSWINTDDDTALDIEVYRNGVLVFTWEVRNARFARKSDNMGSVRFVAGDLLSVFGRTFTTATRPKNLNITIALSLFNFIQEEDTIQTG